MTPHWLAMLSCVVLAALGHGAAVLTTDTLVVTKETNEQTQNTISFEDFTTSSPPPPIKLISMDVRSEVRLRYAHTAVVARVRNPARVAQETAFRMLLPEAAFISGFTMVLNDKSYEAYVKEKEEAKQIFNDAVSSGAAAAHIATKARDSNHFTVSVNVEPNTTAEFRLTYEELLPRRNGVYNHAVNLHPGALVPSLTVTVHIKESQKITALRVPEVRTGNEVDSTKNDPQNTKAVIERSEDGREVTITFRPDLEEQRNLRNIYAMKTRQDPSADGVLGQFVVQYDVERSGQGEVLMNDGYFVHFFAPTTLRPLSKHVVFVLDTSGSMAERKIVQLREAMQTILSELNQGDYFSLVSFSSDVQVHNLNGDNNRCYDSRYDRRYDRHYNRRCYFFDKNLPASVLSSTYRASPQNIAEAKVIVSRLRANGGTNIFKALDVATDLIQRGVRWDRRKTLEPVIIFLTDGKPFGIGITNTEQIISHITEKNKASIYALAFGEFADRKFLRKLSLHNNGFMRHIYEAADAALQLRDFYRQVASPLLANVHFVYPEEQIKEGSVTKQTFRTLYAGSEAVVAGRYEGSDFAPLVYGKCVKEDNSSLTKRCEMSSPVSRGSEQSLPLERLWAYLTVQQLLDARDVADDKDETPVKKALAIALKYSFVTPLTSLVVVKPNATNAVDAESVDKQIDMQNWPSSRRWKSISNGSPSIRNVFRPSWLSLPYNKDSPSLRRGESISNGWGSKYISNGWGSIRNVQYNKERPSSRFSSHSRHYNKAGAPGQSQYGPLSTRPSVSSTSLTPPPPPSPLGPYHLQLCLWVDELKEKDSDSIVVPVNGTKLELTKDSEAPRESGGDAECARATDGAGGVCVYLTRCAAARAATAADYANTFCAVNNKYAGICCPKSEVDASQN